MTEPSDVQESQDAYAAARGAALKAKADFEAAWATWAEACQCNNEAVEELWDRDNKAFGGDLPLMYPTYPTYPWQLRAEA